MRRRAAETTTPIGNISMNVMLTRVTALAYMLVKPVCSRRGLAIYSALAPSACACSIIASWIGMMRHIRLLLAPTRLLDALYTYGGFVRWLQHEAAQRGPANLTLEGFSRKHAQRHRVCLVPDLPVIEREAELAVLALLR